MVVMFRPGEGRSRLGEDIVAQRSSSAQSPPKPSAPPKPTEQIAEALKGDLMAVFQSEIAALAKLDRAAAYDAAMNNPETLDACFRLFRSKPELFAAHVVDAGRQPVTGDDGALLCGRTL